MGPLDLINHLLNFLAPAVAVGAFLAIFGPFLAQKRPRARVFIAQAAINFVAGALVLFASLWLLGNDGKMMGYGAMVVAIASTQWWAMR